MRKLAPSAGFLLNYPSPHRYVGQCLKSHRDPYRGELGQEKGRVHDQRYISHATPPAFSPRYTREGPLGDGDVHRTWGSLSSRIPETLRRTRSLFLNHFLNHFLNPETLDLRISDLCVGFFSHEDGRAPMTIVQRYEILGRWCSSRPVVFLPEAGQSPVFYVLWSAFSL